MLFKRNTPPSGAAKATKNGKKRDRRLFNLLGFRDETRATASVDYVVWLHGARAKSRDIDYEAIQIQRWWRVLYEKWRAKATARENRLKDVEYHLRGLLRQEETKEFASILEFAAVKKIEIYCSELLRNGAEKPKVVSCADSRWETSFEQRLCGTRLKEFASLALADAESTMRHGVSQDERIIRAHYHVAFSILAQGPPPPPPAPLRTDLLIIDDRDDDDAITLADLPTSTPLTSPERLPKPPTWDAVREYEALVARYETNMTALPETPTTGKESLGHKSTSDASSQYEYPRPFTSPRPKSHGITLVKSTNQERSLRRSRLVRVDSPFTCI